MDGTSAIFHILLLLSYVRRGLCDPLFFFFSVHCAQYKVHAQCSFAALAPHMPCMLLVFNQPYPIIEPGIAKGGRGGGGSGGCIDQVGQKKKSYGSYRVLYCFLHCTKKAGLNRTIINSSSQSPHHMHPFYH